MLLYSPLGMLSHCSRPLEGSHTVLAPRNALILFLPIRMLSHCSRPSECSHTVLAPRNALTLFLPLGMFSHCSHPLEYSHTVLAPWNALILLSPLGMFSYCSRPLKSYVRTKLQAMKTNKPVAIAIKKSFEYQSLVGSNVCYDFRRRIIGALYIVALKGSLEINSCKIGG